MKLKNLFLFSLLLVSLLVITTSLNIFGTTEDDKLKEKISESISNGTPTSPTSLKMYELIEKYSELYSIPKYIAYNIAFLETRYQGPFDISYRPNLTSSAGAVGPMQVMPSTAKLINNEYVSPSILRNDLRLNIETSMKLLNRLYEKYGDWSVVCGCYNTGRPIVNDYAVFCSTNLDYQKNWDYIPEI